MEQSLSEIEIFNAEPWLKGIVDLIRVQCGPGRFTPPSEEMWHGRAGGWEWEDDSGRFIEIELYTWLDDSIAITTYDIEDVDDGPLFDVHDLYPTLALADCAARWFLSPR